MWSGADTGWAWYSSGCAVWESVQSCVPGPLRRARHRADQHRKRGKGWENLPRWCTRLKPSKVPPRLGDGYAQWWPQHHIACMRALNAVRRVAPPAMVGGRGRGDEENAPGANSTSKAHGDPKGGAPWPVCYAARGVPLPSQATRTAPVRPRSSDHRGSRGACSTKPGDPRSSVKEGIDELQADGAGPC